MKTHRFHFTRTNADGKVIADEVSESFSPDWVRYALEHRVAQPNPLAVTTVYDDGSVVTWKKVVASDQPTG